MVRLSNEATISRFRLLRLALPSACTTLFRPHRYCMAGRSMCLPMQVTSVQTSAPGNKTSTRISRALGQAKKTGYQEES